ncbi:MAG: sodium:proton antiporter [Microbacteriaceae bacterium]|nr:sodium:proton antiporter [Microbacteriaceae bacterium]
MNVYYWIIGAILVISVVLAIIRIIRGPSIIDRVVASDVILATILIGLVFEMVVNKHTSTMPIVLVVSMFGITGTVAVARFMSRKDES